MSRGASFLEFSPEQETKVVYHLLQKSEKMERLMLSPPGEFFLENRNSSKIDQNSQTEIPNRNVRSIC